jgi:hypothetical protein
MFCNFRNSRDPGAFHCAADCHLCVLPELFGELPCVLFAVQARQIIVLS